MKHHTTLIFKEKNYFFMLLGIAIITLGFILMSGGGSDDPKIFDASIFSFTRIHIAPTLVLLGFGVEVYAILISSTSKKDKTEENNSQS